VTDKEQSSVNRDLHRFARMLDWNLLRTFTVIVHEGGITHAANRLLLTQPSVSAALKRLEDTVGRQLIDRRPGRFAVTPAGQRLYRECLDIYGTILRLEQAVDDSPELLTGHIRIVTVSQVVSPIFDRLLAAFFGENPKVSVSIDVVTTADVILLIEQRAATIGLSDGIIPSHFESLPLRNEQYALYCGRTHGLYGKSDLLLEDLRGEAYVGFTADVLGGEHMGPVTALRAAASFGQMVRGSSANVEEVVRLIRAGVGIGMVPTHLSEPHEATGDLWRLPPYNALPETEMHLIWNPRTKWNDAEGAFLDTIKRG